MAVKFLLHSSELRRAIELCKKKPPTNEEGVHFEKRASNASVSDFIRFDDVEKNGIRVYSRWPDKKGIGPRVAHMDWDAAKDRHFVVSLKVDYEEAYTAAQAKVSMEDWEHVITAQRQVLDIFKEKKRSDQGKLIARTVLFLFQLLATAIT